MEPVKIHSAIVDDLNHYLEHNRALPHTRYAIENLMNNFRKKEITVSKDLEDVSFGVFSAFNIRGRTWKIQTPPDIDYIWLDSVLSNVAYRVEQALRPLEFSEDEWLLAIARRGDFGTGSSVGTEQNYFYKQLAGKLTFSNPCTLVAYKELCRNDKSGWRASEIERQYNHGCKLTPFGNCTFVPKDTSKYRMVVTELSLDMFFQRGFATYFDDALQRFYGIDIKTQEPLNKAMARKGSLDQSLSTIDSTSASDSIYLDALHEAGVLADWHLSIINSIKSRYVRYGQKTIKLSMIGTQGCGFTFSFMTFLLSSIVEGVYHTVGIDVINGKNFGVYGDDVICVTSCYDKVIKAMKMFGFVPNESKSFSSGPFRESCGGDYYDGHNVRSFYLKRCNSPSDEYIIFNRLFKWSLDNGVMLYNTLDYIFQNSTHKLKVPPYENEDAGFHDFRVRGRYKARLPKKPSMRMPDCHYDGRMQMAIKGYITGTRVLCRRKDGEQTQYKVVSKFAATLGYPSYAVEATTLYRSSYSTSLTRVWSYIER